MLHVGIGSHDRTAGIVPPSVSGTGRGLEPAMVYGGRGAAIPMRDNPALACARTTDASPRRRARLALRHAYLCRSSLIA